MATRSYDMRPPELIFDKQHPPLDKNAQVLRLMTMLDDALHQESPEDEIKLKDFRNSLNQIKSDYGDQETGSILQILLHQAFFSKLYMVRSLLKEGADINKTFKVGDREGTILSFVIEAQAWTKLNRVISGGADVTAIKRDKQQEILIPAIEAEQFLFVNALLLQPGAPELLKQSLKELKISKSLSSDIIVKLIKLYLDFPHTPGIAEELKEIYQDNKDQFKTIVASLPDEFHGFLQTVADGSFSDSYKHICPFSCGRGRIDYEAGLTACASIAATQKSSYKFDPTVLKNPDELKEYFKFISDNITSMNNQCYKFVLSGVHWISGVIELKDGIPTILFVDSLGKEKFNGNLAVIAKEAFSSSQDIKIMVAEQARQTSQIGCSVFALDDVRKLFKVTELSSDLNPSMLRTTESTTRIKADKERAEKKEQYEKPVNARNQSFDDSFQENLKPQGPDATKLINTRIDYKLSKLCEKVTRFVSGNSDQEIQEAKHGFSLAGFKERTSLSQHHTNGI